MFYFTGSQFEYTDGSIFALTIQVLEMVLVVDLVLSLVGIYVMLLAFGIVSSNNARTISVGRPRNVGLDGMVIFLCHTGLDRSFYGNQSPKRSAVILTGIL